MKKLLPFILPAIASAYTLTNTDCLVINTFHEANTATPKEQRLVADVVLNRVALDDKLDSCKVVFAKNQFTWTKKYKRRNKFASFADMLDYYKVPLDSYNKLQPLIADVILSHSVVSYKSPTMYHDKTVNSFGSTVHPSELIKIKQTKNFVFYAEKKKVEKIK